MPRIKSAKGIPPHLKLISTLIVGGSVSPTKIDEIIPYTKGYASKYIFELKKLGFIFETKKNGRNIVEWKLISEPVNAEELRNRGKTPLNNKTINKIADYLMKEIGLF